MTLCAKIQRKMEGPKVKKTAKRSSRSSRSKSLASQQSISSEDTPSESIVVVNTTEKEMPSKDKEEEEPLESGASVSHTEEQPSKAKVRRFWGTFSNGRRIGYVCETREQASEQFEKYAKNPVVGGIGVRLVKIQ